jgi:hypothetical protein|uniref:Glycosyl transferase family 1 domain-containing protein n=1 Tax=viral metagenome TaxID=1070528 RepID=A0A6C0IP36_9ZZZZ
MNIAFWDNQLCERGTSVSLYDYAHYNEKILGNTSYIFYNKNNSENKEPIIEKFKQRFIVHGVNSFNEVDFYLIKYKVSHIYVIKFGKNDSNKSSVAKTCNHCVFDASEPHGDVYAAVSKCVKGYTDSIPIVSHMIDLPNHTLNMREELSIPADAIVFGGYGGANSFDIKYVHEVIYDVAKENKHMYFLFANFNRFCPELPNIIHLPMITSMDKKTAFINTCDAQIWGCSLGETFGIAIGEFSMKNKPIIASKVGTLNHALILKEKGLWYQCPEELRDIFVTFYPKESKTKELNAYTEYTPEKVMRQFNEVFLQ